MQTAEEINAAIAGGQAAPAPERILAGKCPACSQLLVSAFYYVESKGYYIAWECWAKLQAAPTCTYRRVL